MAFFKGSRHCVLKFASTAPGLPESSSAALESSTPTPRAVPAPEYAKAPKRPPFTPGDWEAVNSTLGVKGLGRQARVGAPSPHPAAGHRASREEARAAPSLLDWTSQTGVENQGPLRHSPGPTML